LPLAAWPLRPELIVSVDTKRVVPIMRRGAGVPSSAWPDWGWLRIAAGFTVSIV
jgi:hypothetical protein